ncbi:MAG: enoyl-CoA hydratase [Acidiferrobacterales bacterium]|nr:enoyl-CoA hydratase [Acidiferrobacterales bacterium]
MAYEHIITETRGKVGLITLNRPKVLNALSSEVMDELGAALDAYEADSDIGAVVITGNEKAFAAGADISQMKDNTFADAYMGNFISRNWERVTECRKPVVAAVAGYALGGGCELAMMCDFIVAGDNAQFGQPEILLGIIPGAGGTQRLTRAVGKSKAMDMCLTGRRMDAEEAERSGLVSRVFPADELVDRAVEIAQEIAQFSQVAASMVTETVDRAYELTLSEGILFERRAFHSMFSTNDQKEGMAAFVEKRKPTWHNS